MKGSVYFIIIKRQSPESPLSVKLLTLWFESIEHRESFFWKVIFLPLLSRQESHREEGTWTDSALNTSCWFQAQTGSFLPAGPAGPSPWQPWKWGDGKRICNSDLWEAELHFWQEASGYTLSGSGSASPSCLTLIPGEQISQCEPGAAVLLRAGLRTGSQERRMENSDDMGRKHNLAEVWLKLLASWESEL